MRSKHLHFQLICLEIFLATLQDCYQVFEYFNTNLSVPMNNHEFIDSIITLFFQK